METDLTVFYYTIFIILGSVAYAGTDNTLKLIRYIELTIRLSWINFKTKRLRKKLKRDLDSLIKQLQKDTHE